jgi:hypothetical protein
MVADGQNLGGLRAWINDHRRMQVKNWPLGGQTTWEVEVVEAGDYHLGSDADRAWQEASGFWKTDTTEFWNKWTAVIGEAGER